MKLMIAWRYFNLIVFSLVAEANRAFRDEFVGSRYL